MTRIARHLREHPPRRWADRDLHEVLVAAVLVAALLAGAVGYLEAGPHPEHDARPGGAYDVLP